MYSQKDSIPPSFVNGLPSFSTLRRELGVLLGKRVLLQDATSARKLGWVTWILSVPLSQPGAPWADGNLAEVLISWVKWGESFKSKSVKPRFISS